MAAALLPLAVVLALILIGVVQGREDRYDFAALRWEAWQLVAGFIVLVLFAAHTARLIALCVALAFAVAVFVRKRLTRRESDYYF